MGININDNPHIVLGLGDWAVGYGGGADHHDNAVGFISFFPLESSVTELDTPVDPDNVIEIDDPAFSLVFADVQAARRLIASVEDAIRAMETEKL